jgi:ribonucleotide reductase alpha subunit
MKKVKNDDYWYLMCPNKCPNLHLCYGEKFETLYQSYVDNGKYEKKIKARELWFKILDCQMETGTPYMLYKDACNEKSNQKNLGTIRSSNLCCEIVEYSDHNESAVCNLASISLSSMVDASGEFDYDKLYKTTQILTENLNNVIDLNYYPTFKTENSNQKNRPIGIGVQGLADVFALMNIPFHSDKAREINKNIFETMYYASLQKSMVLSSNKINDLNTINKYFNQNNNDDVNRFKMGIYGDIWKYNKDIKFENNKINDIYHKLKLSYNDINLHKDETFKGAYSTFKNSPLQKGLFQFDLWNVKPSNRYNWEELREYIKINGVVNSLLIAPMPTASTSQILGNNECFEPFTSNMYTRRTLAGEFLVINKYLINDLIKLNIWNVQMKDSIIEHKGSIQNIPDIPEEIKNKYKIVWEIPMKHIINMAKDRGAFICQSQSMNLWVEEPNYQILTSMHMYSWSSGLKTGLYYLRRKAKHQAQQFTIIPENKENNEELSSKSDECLMCGS